MNSLYTSVNIICRKIIQLLLESLKQTFKIYLTYESVGSAAYRY